MAQSALTVTTENPTPPTNLSFVGATPPLDPAQPAVDDGVNNGTVSFNEPSGNPNVFAAKTAAAGSGVSYDAEGLGTETLFTQTYGPNIYAPVILKMDGCGAAYTTSPNRDHASSLSPSTNPTLTSIAPTTAVSGATGTDTITATGTGFTPQSVIYSNGVKQKTTYVSPTSLTAAVNKQTAAGAVPVTVVTGGVVTTAGQTLTYS